MRLVRQLRAELGTDHGTVQRIANQLGYGVESVRAWVRQADVDEGVSPGMASEEAARIKALEREVKEFRRANSILKSASAEHQSRRRIARRADESSAASDSPLSEGSYSTPSHERRICYGLIVERRS